MACPEAVGLTAINPGMAPPVGLMFIQAESENAENEGEVRPELVIEIDCGAGSAPIAPTKFIAVGERAMEPDERVSVTGIEKGELLAPRAVTITLPL